MLVRYQSPTLRPEITFGNWTPFKNDEKCFLFQLKSFFHSQDFCLESLVIYKNGLIGKASLISKLMTSQPGK